MCGIAGVIDASGAVDDALVARMCAAPARAAVTAATRTADRRAYRF